MISEPNQFDLAFRGVAGSGQSILSLWDSMSYSDSEGRITYWQHYKSDLVEKWDKNFITVEEVSTWGWVGGHGKGVTRRDWIPCCLFENEGWITYWQHYKSDLVEKWDNNLIEVSTRGGGHGKGVRGGAGFHVVFKNEGGITYWQHCKSDLVEKWDKNHIAVEETMRGALIYLYVLIYKHGEEGKPLLEKRMGEEGLRFYVIFRQ